MTALKQLSAVYVAAASAFTIAIVLAQHPDLARTAAAAARIAGETAAVAATGLNEHVLKPGYVLVREESARGWQALADAMRAPPARVARNEAKKPAKLQVAKPQIASHEPQRLVAPKPVLAKPAIAAVEPAVKPLAPPLLRPQIVPPAAPAPESAAPNPPFTDHPPGPAELAHAEQHLKDSLTREMLANFDLFLYVSKADKGPLAQRMYVFAKEPAGGLTLRYNWPASTGRELVEYNAEGRKLPSFTPQGYYELDPHRFYRRYTSMQWKQPMPYAMFFNWVHDGDQTGLAIHAAHGKDIALLGQRASGGCIHLAPADAAALFDLIRTQYKGAVPLFAYDRKTATMSNDGILLHDAHGNLRFAEGYKVLVFIENYGGENVVATLM